MLFSGSVEQDITTIACMKRKELKIKIRDFQGRFKMDFSESYLNSATEDHLRHILYAARVQTKRRN
ncbi:MAG: hypothetical protein HQ515_26720 [Phycisphaeraceae bacterium]|nr:hypothetical protein [Phycisphaeraceae bacterium]